VPAGTGVGGGGGGGAVGHEGYGLDMVEDVGGCMWRAVQDVGTYQTVVCEECETERVKDMEVPWWQETISCFFQPKPSFEESRMQAPSVLQAALGRRKDARARHASSH